MRKLLIGTGMLLLLWWIIAALKLIDPFFFPGPWNTFSAFIQLLSSGLVDDAVATVLRTLSAFGFALVVGVPLGLFLGKTEVLYRNIEFIVDFFRSTPATALFPLFMLIFGIGDASKIAAAAFAGLLIVLFNTAYGVINSKKIRMLAARLHGASRWQVFKWIIFWESLPQTFVGLRNAISLTLAIIIVTEMFVGTDVGLGRKIIDFQMVYNIPAMYATILMAGILGYILNALLAMSERRIVHWNRSS